MTRRDGPLPCVRALTRADLAAALRAGWDDFRHLWPSAVPLCLPFPLLGAGLALAAVLAGVPALLYPLAAGFALVAPFAVLGPVELSRRRERGLPTAPADVLALWGSPARTACLTLGCWLGAILVGWLYAAQFLTAETLGVLPTTVPALAAALFATDEGWLLIVLGNAAGFLFAVLAFSTSIVALPLMLDRGASAVVAADASVRVVLAAPAPAARWALLIALLLLAGALPLLLGLLVVVPVLGHASWHLYRRAVPG